MAKKTWLESVNDDLAKIGFSCDDYSPGDGVTRYRFFAMLGGRYFADDGKYTALGRKEAETYMAGLFAGYYSAQAD